ncbi:MAG: tryptophan--tRNA ligase, partial [Meiothermus sp.]|nr:tryptophan--tRNA ligase [Meiothermus sp.]
IGTLVVKQLLMQEMMKTLRPIRERAAELRAHPERVLDALEDGAAKARRIAQATMEEVREKFGLLRAGGRGSGLREQVKVASK